MVKVNVGQRWRSPFAMTYDTASEVIGIIGRWVVLQYPGQSPFVADSVRILRDYTLVSPQAQEEGAKMPQVNPESMTDEQLDAAVREEVAGRENVVCDFAPTTNPADAWRLLEKLCAGSVVTVLHYAGEVRCFVDMQESNAPTLPRALCIAALRAARGRKERT